MSSTSILDKIGDPVAGAVTLGKAIAESGMFGCPNIGSGVVIAFDCLHRDAPLLDFQAEKHLILGKPSLKSEAMLARLIRDGGEYEWINDASDGNGVATIKIASGKRSGTASYSMEDARLAKLIKADSGWVKNPTDMLRARVVSRAMRMYAPHLVVGLYTPEEIHDFSDGNDDGSQATAAPAALTDESSQQGQYTAGVTTATASATTEPKRGRGRPPKSQSAEAPVEPQAATSQDTPAAPALTSTAQAPDASGSDDSAAGATELQPSSEAAATVSTATATGPVSESAEDQIARIKAMYIDLGFKEKPEKWAKIMEALKVEKIGQLDEEGRKELLDYLGKYAIKQGKAKDSQSLSAWVNSLFAK